MQSTRDVQTGKYLKRYEVSSKPDFWRAVLTILDSLIDNESKLTDTEMDIMVYVLCQKPGAQVFRGAHRARMMTFLGQGDKAMSTQALSIHLRSLTDKGWVERGLPDNVISGIQRHLDSTGYKGLELSYLVELDKPL